MMCRKGITIISRRQREIYPQAVEMGGHGRHQAPNSSSFRVFTPRTLLAQSYCSPSNRHLSIGRRSGLISCRRRVRRYPFYSGRSQALCRWPYLLLAAARYLYRSRKASRCDITIDHYSSGLRRQARSC
jgi:hypothetical protein